jgi:ATP-dependent RNA helicase RhlE
MLFKELDIIAPILKNLEAQGYTQPTPIQAKSIPLVLDGSDVLGCAQTGT